MIDFVKVDIENLNYWYYNANGNLYFRKYGTDDAFEVVDDWDYQDLYDAICYEELELIWIRGMSLGTNVEV